MEFLGISFWEFLLIMIVIVVVVGPAKIPGIMRTLGTIVRNIRKTTTELTASITREIELENLKKAAGQEPAAGDKKPKAAKPAAPAAAVGTPPTNKVLPPTNPATPPATEAPPQPESRDSLPAGRSTRNEQ